MIVKNEAENLPQCLASVVNVVDEMVVLDTGSTDKTIGIAQQFGAKVSFFAWCNDFSAARNEALKQVQGDWVLVLDADEVLSANIVSQIKKAIENENNLAVNLIRHEIGATQSPYSLVSRLFRNHPEIKFNRPYHAIIDDSVTQLIKKELHWQVINLPAIAILHYGYQPEAIASLDKSNRAKKAMEGFLSQHPNDPYTCNKLGALYLKIGLEKEGIKLLIKGLKSNKADVNTLFELHYHLANAYVRQKKIELAVKHYQKAIDQPILPSLKLGAYNNLGSLLLEMRNYQNACKIYELVLRIDPNFALGYYNLAMAFKAMGRLPESAATYQKAIALNPDYAPAYQNLGVVLYKLGKLPESLDAFKNAIRLHQAQNRFQDAENLRQGLQDIGMILEVERANN